MKECSQKSTLFIILFEEFFAESTFLGSQVKQFFIVVFRIEIHGEHTCDVVSATTELSAYVDDDFIVEHLF